jgi:endonuclease YncB( thermonuclease family)
MMTGPWRCGDAAEKRLRSLAEGRRIECHQKDRDRYGRVVAVCLAAGRDLNAEMVRSGLALAYRQFGLDYVAQEEEARRAKRGMWAGEFEPPWEWRRR